MFTEFMDYLMLGKRIDVYGTEWIILKELGHGIALAVEAKGDFPGQVMAIQLPLKDVKDFEVQ